MKKIIKALLVVLVLFIAIALIRYRTLSPCGMLKKEWVEDAREGVESASERAREAAEEVGGRTERIADDVGDAVEESAKEIAEALAETLADEKSFGECMAELWKLKTGG